MSHPNTGFSHREREYRDSIGPLAISLVYTHGLENRLVTCTAQRTLNYIIKGRVPRVPSRALLTCESVKSQKIYQPATAALMRFANLGFDS